MLRDLLAGFPLVDGLFRRFLWSRVHFPEIEMRFLQSLERGSIDIAIDVGAAMGSYAWILNRKAREVCAFEPGERHGRYLERVAFGSRIRVLRAAVGGVCGRFHLYTPGSNTDGLHSATMSAQNPITAGIATQVREVEQVTLDSFFLAENLDATRSVDVLKIDVEGYELEVVKGAQTLISRHHPLILCEIERRHNAEYANVFKLLRDAGYRSYVFQSGAFRAFDGDTVDHLQPPDALQSRLDGSYDPANNSYVNNFVFQHPQSRIKVSK